MPGRSGRRGGQHRLPGRHVGQRLTGRGGGRRDRRVQDHPQGAVQRVPQQRERHHAVDHAVSVQILGGLHPGRERFAVQVLVHPRPRKPISAPGSAAVTCPSEPQEANTPPVVG